MKPLYRSKTKRRVAGVLGGAGKYFGVDPTLLRVLFVLGAFAVGIVPAVLAYIIAAIIIPEEGDPDAA
jgi:phage shock protein PspC (stress-responsive transcriptional regulator)